MLLRQKKVNENIYLGLDADGNPVNMTMELAKPQAHIKEFSFVEIEESEGVSLSNQTTTPKVIGETCFLDSTTSFGVDAKFLPLI